MALTRTNPSASFLKRYVKEADVAKSLHLDPKTVYRMRKQGLLPYLRLGPRTILFDPVAVAAALEKFTVNGAR